MQEREEADLRRNRTGAGAPRDDSAWPPWAAAFSVAASLGCAVAVIWIVAAREQRSEAVLIGALAVVGAVLSGWALWRGSQAMIDGRPAPGWVTGLVLAVLAACFVGWVTRPVLGVSGFLGTMVGIFGVNVVAQRSARRNRAVVRSLQREEEDVDRVYEEQRVRDQRQRPPAEEARLGALLRRRRAQERRHLLAWLLAAVPLLLGGFLLEAPVPFGVAVGGFALCAVLWVGRRLTGAWLAERDFQRADTPPRRAFVVLLNDPAPKMVRPLLAVWAERPVSRDGAFPKADQVYRADEEVDDLLSHQGSVELHEAWVDTGPRSWSKPRWVAANGGIALPHRRAFLGRLYVSMLLRSERPDRPERLDIREPHPSREVDQSTPRLPGLGRAIAWRLGLLAVGGAFFAFLD
jgi:hypothetical protein